MNNCPRKQPRRTHLLLLTVFFGILGTSSLLFAWGAWGHQHISHAAVFALPPEMRIFFYNHIDYITTESTVPDVRKFAMTDREEYGRHFIDVEGFGDKPFETLPKTWKEAKAKYSADTLQKFCTLPWYVQEMQTKLTTAFKERRKDAILFLAGDIAHYIADAYMPLHTSLNHDGQLTDQRGAARLQGAAVDMGAYETPAGSLTNCSLDMDGDSLVQANKEGLVLVRAMLGFSTANAVVGSGISQAQWAAVKANLNANCGTSFTP